MLGTVEHFDAAKRRPFLSKRSEASSKFVGRAGGLAGGDSPAGGGWERARPARVRSEEAEGEESAHSDRAMR